MFVCTPRDLCRIWRTSQKRPRLVSSLPCRRRRRHRGALYKSLIGDFVCDYPPQKSQMVNNASANVIAQCDVSSCVCARALAKVETAGLKYIAVLHIGVVENSVYVSVSVCECPLASATEVKRVAVDVPHKRTSFCHARKTRAMWHTEPHTTHVCPGLGSNVRTLIHTHTHTQTPTPHLASPQRAAPVRRLASHTAHATRVFVAQQPHRLTGHEALRQRHRQNRVRVFCLRLL